MENKTFWQKFAENKKLFWGVIGGAAALLVIAGVVLALTLGGGAEMNGCVVTVKTEGGMALEGVGVYIYEKADQKEMVSYAKTDADGKIAFTETIPAGSVIVLENVPVGYVAAENYAVKETTEIVLSSELLKEMSAITLGGIMFDFTVQDTEGTEYTLSQLLKEKKAVVLNLWYTNCGPCKAEFPFLQQAYDKYSSDIALLALDPVAEDDNAAITAFKAANGLTFPMAKADAKWAEQIKNIAYPTTVVIDRYGMVALLHTGGIDNAKTFKDAFAFFAAEDYVQTTVDSIGSLVTEDTDDDQEETTAPPETTVPSTTAPTEPVETTKPSGSSGSNSGSSSGSNSGSSSGSSANYNGTLVNPDEPVEQFGYNDFSIEVGAGEKKLVWFCRLIGKATLRIKDKDAYVVYKDKTYKPDKSGLISISMSSDQPNAITEMQFGNSGKTNKTFQITFVFAKGTRENPNKLEVGQTTIKCASGNDQGTFCKFKASKKGTLTLTVVSISPSTVICGIAISDMQEIPNVVELQEGEKTVSIELPAGATAEITFFTRDPNKEWKIPAADIKVDIAFS